MGAAGPCQEESATGSFFHGRLGVDDETARANRESARHGVEVHLRAVRSFLGVRRPKAAHRLRPMQEPLLGRSPREAQARAEAQKEAPLAPPASLRAPGPGARKRRRSFIGKACPLRYRLFPPAGPVSAFVRHALTQQLAETRLGVDASRRGVARTDAAAQATRGLSAQWARSAGPASDFPSAGACVAPGAGLPR